MDYALYRPSNSSSVVHIAGDNLPSAMKSVAASIISKIKRIHFLTFHNFTSMAFVDIQTTISPDLIDNIFQNNFEYICVWYTGVVIHDSSIDKDIVEYMQDRTVNVHIPDVCKIYVKNSPRVLQEDVLPSKMIEKLDFVIDEHSNIYKRLKDKRDIKVFAGNNEPCYKNDLNNEFDNNLLNTFIVPCSGLNQFSYMIPHIDAIQKIIFYDVNVHSIEWMKFVIANWNGSDSMRILAEQFRSIYKHDFEFLFYDDIVQQYFDIFKDVSPAIIEKIRHSDIQFVQCDITSESHKITDIVTGADKVFINISNIWHYESNYINSDHISVDREFFNLIYNLKNNSEMLYIRGQTPSCKMIRITNVDNIRGFL